MTQTQPLAGDVAIVTGASRGIGRAIAKKLAADGASVVVNYRDAADDAKSLVEQIASDGGTAVAVQADVGNVDEIVAMFDRAVEELGHVSIVVANAARMLVKPVVDSTEDDWDAIYGLNARGTFFVLREAARRIDDGGRVVVLSAGSVGGPPVPGAVLAGGSKAAAVEIARNLAAELAPRAVRVNVVAPGPTATDNFNNLPPERQAAAKSRSLLGGVAEPADIGDTIAYLVGPESRWITGQVIRVTGGG